MEFEITTDLSVLKNQQIGANFEAVSAWLDEELAPYQGMVVQADMIPAAKSYRANLRKVKDRIEQYRKEVKNAVLVPYNEFERKAKILTGKIDAAVENLDSQVKEHEQREADEKIASLKAEYDAYAGDEAKEFLSWERLVNPKWSNKGYRAEDAKQEIYNALSRTERDLAAIRSMGGDNVAYLLDTYRNTLDISEVIRKNTEINARKAIEEQRRREAEERRAAAEAEAQRRKAMEVQEEAPAPVVEAPAEDEKMYTVRGTAHEAFIELVTVSFAVTCTKTQLIALGQYMKSNGIQYRRA